MARLAQWRSDTLLRCVSLVRFPHGKKNFFVSVCECDLKYVVMHARQRRFLEKGEDSITKKDWSWEPDIS